MSFFLKFTMTRVNNEKTEKLGIPHILYIYNIYSGTEKAFISSCSINWSDFKCAEQDSMYVDPAYLSLPSSSYYSMLFNYLNFYSWSRFIGTKTNLSVQKNKKTKTYQSTAIKYADKLSLPHTHKRGTKSLGPIQAIQAKK